MTLDLDGYKAYIGKESVVDLTPREFEILRELLLHKGKILTRKNLLQILWKYEFLEMKGLLIPTLKTYEKN